MELTSLIGFVLIMTIGVIVIDRFVKKMNRQTTEDETVDDIIQTEQEDKEGDFVANNKTSGLTKEKAIAKLKELKELLELEVITQEDYDKEKAILTPIILGKKTRVKEVDTSYTLEEKKERPISISENSDELIDNEYLSFIKRIKNYIIGAYVLGLVWTIGNNGSKTSIYDLIIQPLVIALFVLLVSIVSYFITLSSSKKEENAFKVFKMIYNTLLTIIILVVVFSFIGKT
tara:strand:- start:53 stop:745 length:693 start_codon:yes stop_codon:yes gene_type:complete